MPIELTDSVLNKFIKSHDAYLSPHQYLRKVKINNREVYVVSDSSSRLISRYANDHLKEIEKIISLQGVDESRKLNLSRAAQLIVQDYKKEISNLPWYKKAFYSLMSKLHILSNRHEIDQILQEIEKKTTQVKLGSGLKNLSEQEKNDRANNHRSPLVSDYGRIALTKGPFAQKVKDEMEKRKDELDKLPIDERAIQIAKIKEEACKLVYENDLSKPIADGFYDPAIIPFDIERLLGKSEDFNGTITSEKHLKKMLIDEVKKFKNSGHLTKHQANHLTKDALNISLSYLKAYPRKSYRDAYFLTKDLIRIATYQEIHDKSSFSGSDHGSKHIHHNIQGAKSLHKKMIKGVDYNAKDKFLERLVHFYHDIGYSVGLANNDFDCCKDHPFIGAKMIEDNRDYFLHYLDYTGFKTLRDCVLYHAIINPDLTARDEIDGMHPNMVRSVTSISDACAVTYDRKTQEFWEQPRALIALARLKTFLVLYPEYKQKLGDDIVKGPWSGYDENNPYDKMAYDVFQNTVAELNGMVDDYDIPEDKKNLFRQAIKQQFNAFKANVTLGQYGAELVGLNAVLNVGKQDREGAPDYITEIAMAPSIIYGLLKDLFGKDQANEAFKKLAEEFNGDPKALASELDKLGTEIASGKKVANRKIKTGNAEFLLVGHFDHQIKDPHYVSLNNNLKQVVNEVGKVFVNQKVSMKIRSEVISTFDVWQKNPSRSDFSVFVQETVLPHLPIGNPSISKEMDILITYVSSNPSDEKEFLKIRNALQIILTSDEEYHFMIGKNDDKTALLERTLKV